MDGDFLLNRSLFVLILILSLSIHEWAHALTAHLLGDDTAKDEGRLTLDPIVHVDPIGTFLFPMLGIPIGWAIPVPVNIGNITHRMGPIFGLAVISFAGPLSNFFLWLTLKWVASFIFDPMLGQFISQISYMNLYLGLFNLLPIPPLDGHAILLGIRSLIRKLWSRPL